MTHKREVMSWQVFYSLQEVSISSGKQIFVIKQNQHEIKFIVLYINQKIFPSASEYWYNKSNKTYWFVAKLQALPRIQCSLLQYCINFAVVTVHSYVQEHVDIGAHTFIFTVFISF